MGDNLRVHEVGPFGWYGKAGEIVQHEAGYTPLSRIGNILRGTVPLCI